MNADQQRAEQRIKSKGRLTVMLEGREPILANVCDISPSGMCVEAEIGIQPGTTVCLDGNGIAADALVRYCRLQDGVYRIGLSLQPPD